MPGIRVGNTTEQTISWRAQGLVAAAMAVVLAATLAVYWPALGGDFLFDDNPNLSTIADVGGLDSTESLLRFVFSGGSSLGRPLSFLTFTLHDQHWPTDAFPFKYTNLLIHLLNGVLVFALCRRLVALGSSRASSGNTPPWCEYAALLAAGLWLVHPIQITLVGLVVQRMASLAALFTLAGLLLYLYGRVRLAERPGHGLIAMSLAVGGFGSLAVLSKETGALLPLYILVLEFTVLVHLPRCDKRLWMTWASVFLLLPLLLVAAYFVVRWESLANIYAFKREFTPAERLLTQPSVLFSYLAEIVFPRIAGSGLFHDDFPVSRGLFSPPHTAVAIAGLLGFAGLAIAFRRRLPFFALAVLWFLAGHSLEASVAPIEMYFEHRNYLPMMGIVLLVSIGLFRLPATLRRLSAPLGVAILALLAAMTWAQASTWSDPERLTITWARENPQSTRAQHQMAQLWMRRGWPGRAIASLDKVIELERDNIPAWLQRIFLDCSDGRLQPRHLVPSTILENGPYSTATEPTVKNIDALLSDKKCVGYSRDHLIDDVDVLLKNPRYTLDEETHSSLLFGKATMLEQEGRLEQAMAVLDQAYEVHPSRRVALHQARAMLSKGRLSRAHHYLQKARETEPQLIFRLLGISPHQKTIDALDKAADILDATMQNREAR